jgi:hypothetical protein
MLCIVGKSYFKKPLLPTMLLLTMSNIVVKATFTIYLPLPAMQSIAVKLLAYALLKEAKA